MKSFLPWSGRILLGWILLLPFAEANTVHIAVASNFYPTLLKLIEAIPGDSSTDIKISPGSSGTLYAQILHGAPFDLFLSADQTRPELLEASGHIEPGSRRTYALGQLAMWVPNSTRIMDHRFLKTFEGRIAIANPAIAPYGLAAKQVIDMNPEGKFTIIRGNNVAQAFQFIQTGNVEAGFVALSQLLTNDIAATSYWLVDSGFYTPIRQQMVILKGSQQAVDIHEFIASETAAALLLENGYWPGE